MSLINAGRGDEVMLVAPVLPIQLMRLLDNQKKRLELTELSMKNIAAAFGLVFRAGAALGVGVVFYYCFFVARFFPVGLQAGDTLFFLFVLLGVGVAGIAVSGLGAVAVAPLLMLRQTAQRAAGLSTAKRAAIICLISVSAIQLIFLTYYFALDGEAGPASANGRKPHDWALTIAVAAGAAYFIAAAVISCSWRAAMAYVVLWSSLALFLANMLSLMDGSVAFLFGAAALSGGLYFALALSFLNRRKHGRAGARIAAAMIVFAILLPFFFGPTDKMFGYVFRGVGVRGERTAVIVSQDNLQIMRAAASAGGMPLHACELAAGSYVVSDVDVLWHGIGERSYLAIKAVSQNRDAKNASETNEVRVELDRAGVRRTEAGKRHSCVEFAGSIEFASTSNAIEEEQWRALMPKLNEFLDDPSFAPQKQEGSQHVVIKTSGDATMKQGSLVSARQRACHYQRLLPLMDARAEQRSSNVEVYIDERFGPVDPDCEHPGKHESSKTCTETHPRVVLQRFAAAKKFANTGLIPARQMCGTGADTLRSP